MVIPIVLEGGAGTDAGQRAPDDKGTWFELELWTTSGLDYGYTQARSSVFRSQVVEGTWSGYRVGGADGAEFVVEGGIADLDTAVQLQYEVRALRQGVIWYKGRLSAYEHFTTPDGLLRTRMWAEGYQTKLTEIRVNRTIAAGQTVSQAVQTIYTNDIQPNSRIRMVSTSIVGAYALVGSLIFDCSAAEALRTLALIQGSTEWGVAESAQLYFHSDGTDTSETAHLVLGKSTPEMKESGSFRRAYNRVVAYGDEFATTTSNNAAAQNTYGVRELKVHAPWITNTTDLARYADNIVNAEKDGSSRLYGVKEGPTERLENARVNPSATIPAQGKFTFWGVDGAKTTEHFVKIRYTYRTSSPTRFYAEAWAGAPDEGLTRELYRLRSRVDALFHAASGITGGSNHNLLSATHGDTVAATVVRGDIIVGNATPAWARLALGGAGKVLRSDGADALWSTFTIPDTMAINTLLYASSANVLATIAAAASSILVTSGASVPSLATDIPTAVTIGGAYVYRVGGTDVAIADGGTGASTALAGFNALSPLTTRGDLLTRDASNNVRLGIGVAARVLRSDGTDPSWAQVVLTTDVTGTLPIANGGTGATSATAAFNALDPLTTKGDLIVHDGTNSIRLGVGSNGQILTADSAAASGVKWADAASGSDAAADAVLRSIAFGAP